MAHSFPHFPKHFLDPFGGDPFKESDPFSGSAPDDFFKKQTKNDPFTSDPFTKNPSLSSKVSDAGRQRRSEALRVCAPCPVRACVKAAGPGLPSGRVRTPSFELCLRSLTTVGPARPGGSPGALSRANSHYWVACNCSCGSLRGSSCEAGCRIPWSRESKSGGSRISNRVQSSVRSRAPLLQLTCL